LNCAAKTVSSLSENSVQNTLDKDSSFSSTSVEIRGINQGANADSTTTRNLENDRASTKAPFVGYSSFRTSGDTVQRNAPVTLPTLRSSRGGATRVHVSSARIGRSEEMENRTSPTAPSYSFLHGSSSPPSLKPSSSFPVSNRGKGTRGRPVRPSNPRQHSDTFDDTKFQDSGMSSYGTSGICTNSLEFGGVKTSSSLASLASSSTPTPQPPPLPSSFPDSKRCSSFEHSNALSAKGNEGFVKVTMAVSRKTKRPRYEDRNKEHDELRISQ